MMEVGSQGESNMGSRQDARRRFVRLLSGHHMRAAVAGLMLIGGATLSNGAYAQAQSNSSAAPAANCSETCLKGKEKCYQEGATDEYCAYELKTCQKACGK